MRVLATLLLLSAGLGACKKPADGESAPVPPDGKLAYEVTESTPAGAFTWDVKLELTPSRDGYRVALVSSRPDAEPLAPFTVDHALRPADNVIGAESIGRLYLPVAARAAGQRTPCGAVGPQRKYKSWDVWPVEGLCGKAYGTRFYDVTSGLLIGWLFSAPSDITASAKGS